MDFAGPVEQFRAAKVVDVLAHLERPYLVS
jgi:hypothetical protein